MARKQMVTVIDDLDGREIDPDDARTVSWTWLGVHYELDVSPTILTKIEDGKVTIAKLLAVSTRTGGRRRLGPATSRTRATSASDPARNAAIRNWAHSNGYEVSARGRIPLDVIEAFDAAH
ncbi:histone-like nucleoid-structuring protein Lsr2 [Gordonia lacunae]|uniref:Nucleoid-associated protein Lsr2 n=1 Tax=Gordonia lacunae TaxID=417102 RepID=A0A243Q3F0_9ACTN|nr:Lsr2 family protein [Gordonia lacunae]OUC75817.1 hypothetical protein CA982_24865 [Gordonia lacunae]